MTTAEIVIEHLQEEEYADYRKVLVESYGQYEKDYKDPEQWASYLNDIRASVGNPNAQTILIARRGDEILGDCNYLPMQREHMGCQSLIYNRPSFVYWGFIQKEEGRELLRNYCMKALPLQERDRIRHYTCIQEILCRLLLIFIYL